MTIGRPPNRHTTASQFYFRFWFSCFRSFGDVEIYFGTKYRRDISNHGCDITTSVFWKQTSAILEFYFRFQYLRLRHNRRVILPTKFHPNRTIRDGVMTSYPFFKMAARASQFYFRFQFSWFRLSGNLEIYRHTKFRRYIPIHGWDITTSGF